MDPIVGALVIAGLKYVGQPGAELVRDFVGRIVGPTGDELGKALADPVREWNERRQQRGIDTLESAARMLDDAGRSASPVPGRILFPLLQAASVEEDENLRRMWASLLANAADAQRPDDILPAFVSILKELGPVEALILENLYAQESGEDSNRIDYSSEHPTARFNPSKLRILTDGVDGTCQEIELPFDTFRVVADNLMRLGVVEQYFTGATYGSEVSHRVYSELTLTPLGHQLVRLCVTPPKRSQPPPNHLS